MYYFSHGANALGFAWTGSLFILGRFRFGWSGNKILTMSSADFGAVFALFT